MDRTYAYRSALASTYSRTLPSFVNLVGDALGEAPIFPSPGLPGAVSVLAESNAEMGLSRDAFRQYVAAVAKLGDQIRFVPQVCRLDNGSLTRDTDYGSLVVWRIVPGSPCEATAQTAYASGVALATLTRFTGVNRLDPTAFNGSHAARSKTRIDLSQMNGSEIKKLTERIAGKGAGQALVAELTFAQSTAQSRDMVVSHAMWDQDHVAVKGAHVTSVRSMRNLYATDRAAAAAYAAVRFGGPQLIAPFLEGYRTLDAIPTMTDSNALALAQFEALAACLAAETQPPTDGHMLARDVSILNGTA